MKVRLVAEFDPQVGRIKILEGPMGDGILFMGMLEMLKIAFLESRKAPEKKILVPQFVAPNPKVS